MEYEQLRQQAQDGDVLMVEGRAFISRFIRMFSGESVSHIAVLFWLDGGLFVAEFLEGKNYLITPASQWFEEYKKNKFQVLFGMAPKMVRGNAAISQVVAKYRADKSLQAYGWWTFLRIWVAQWTNKNYQVKAKVCSTFVAAVWSECGYRFARTPDPGDYLAMCQLTMPVTFDPAQP
jgi:hypothetical protein